LSIKQVVKDLSLLSLFLGLILTCALTIYFYLVYHEMHYVLIALLIGLTVTLMGVAKYVFTVDFWGTIIKYWRKMKRKMTANKIWV